MMTQWLCCQVYRCVLWWLVSGHMTRCTGVYCDDSSWWLISGCVARCTGVYYNDSSWWLINGHMARCTSVYCGESLVITHRWLCGQVYRHALWWFKRLVMTHADLLVMSRWIWRGMERSTLKSIWMSWGCRKCQTLVGNQQKMVIPSFIYYYFVR